MGLSASQARYISLVARMSDVEYQGQQINQERTTLSNQVNDLYNSLLDLSVPTPPSTSEYTEVRYETSIGATRYTIESVRPDRDDDHDWYRVNMSYAEVDDYLTPLSNRYVSIDEDNNYYYGTIENGVPIHQLADVIGPGQPINDDDLESYLNAIRNYFPEYADYENDDLISEIMVYFTSEGGEYIPHFMKKVQVEQYVSPTNGYGWVPAFDYISNGSFNAIRTFEDCTLTFDAQGLISQIGIPVYEGDTVVAHNTYNLTATTVTNQEAYNDAFREYEAAKYLYDKKQQEINAKTSIIQREDKNLELKLTRLDNERSALKTEMDAVKKVIDDAIEKGFKTFSG